MYKIVLDIFVNFNYNVKMRKWTKELEKELIDLYNKGLKDRELAEHFNSTRGAMSVKLSNLRKQGKIELRIEPWTEEELTEFKWLRDEGFSNKEIQENFMPHKPASSFNYAARKVDVVKLNTLEWTDEQLLDAVREFRSTAKLNEAAVTNRFKYPSPSAVVKRFGSMRNARDAAGIPQRDRIYKDWTDDELLAFVETYVTRTAYEEACKGNMNMPAASTIASRFDNWKGAQARAGVLHHRKSGGLQPGVDTIVYLVNFIDEDFLKLGITQRSVKERLKGYPEYEILWYENYDYPTARLKEKEWLVKLDKYRYTPKNPYFKMRGSTECFKLPS